MPGAAVLSYGARQETTALTRSTRCGSLEGGFAALMGREGLWPECIVKRWSGGATDRGLLKKKQLIKSTRLRHEARCWCTPP